MSRLEIADAGQRRTPGAARSGNRNAVKSAIPRQNPRRRYPEKVEEKRARRLMEALGFTTWSLSQARATRQTPGWPDAFFTHPEKKLAVWYEAKAPSGKQSEAQKEFQRHTTMCGHDYVLGVADELFAWCERKGLIRVFPGGGMEVIR